MRIESVAARVLRVTPPTNITAAGGRYSEFSSVLVEVRTDDGLVGYGEAIARAGAEAASAAVEKLLGPAIVGADPSDIGALHARMSGLLRRFGHARGVVVEAISGVDIALWDLAGKAAGKPIRDLLYGAGRDRVPVYSSAVYIDTEERMVAQARDQVAAGFSMVKLKAGHSAEQGGKEADVAKVAAIRDAVGSQVALAVDANSAYVASDAVWVAKRFEELGIAFFEEPVNPDDLAGYQRVRDHSDIALAGGETAFLVYDFRAFLERGLLDVVQPDLARCGGVTGAWQAAALTHAFNAKLAPHTGLSGGISHLAALQFAAAAPGLDKLEYMFIDNPLVEIFVGGYPKPSAGMIEVPTGPGLGLEIDLDLVERYSVH